MGRHGFKSKIQSKKSQSKLVLQLSWVNSGQRVVALPNCRPSSAQEGSSDTDSAPTT